MHYAHAKHLDPLLRARARSGRQAGARLTWTRPASRVPESRTHNSFANFHFHCHIRRISTSFQRAFRQRRRTFVLSRPLSNKPAASSASSCLGSIRPRAREATCLVCSFPRQTLRRGNGKMVSILYIPSSISTSFLLRAAHSRHQQSIGQYVEGEETEH